LLPHHDVYARLAPSPIHGIGVFAIRDIPAGAAVLEDPGISLTPIPKETVDALDPSHRRLYEDFCVLEDGAYFSPPSFNQITIAWYLNHSDSPNLSYGLGSAFYAVRLIRKGEELTADYHTYSPSGLPWAR
jgi:SET domain-containing protein